MSVKSFMRSCLQPLLPPAYLLGLLFFAALNVGQLSALAQTQYSSECLSPSAVRQLRSEFDFRIATASDGKPYEGPIDPCNQNLLSTKAIRALMLLTSVDELPALPPNFRLDLIKDNAKTFMRGLIKKIVIGSDNPFCQSVNAFVDAKVPETIFLCPGLKGSSDATTAAIIVHEAYHLNPGSTGHVDCEPTLLVRRERKGCDSSIYAKGAYAIEVELALRMARATQLSTAVRSQFRSLAMARLVANFNDLPFGLRAGAILQRNDGRAFYYDGNEAVELPSIPKSVVWARHGFVHGLMADGTLAVIRPPDVYRYTDSALAAMGLDFEALRKEEIIDVQTVKKARHDGPPSALTCALTKMSLTCSDGEGNSTRIDASKLGGAIGLGTLGDDFTLLHGKGVYTALNQNFIKAGTLKGHFAQTTLEFTKTWRTLVGLDLQDSKIVFLDVDGHVGKFEKEKSKTGELDPLLRNQTFWRISAPVYWSKTLGEL